ncbi:MAG: phosphoribosyl-AMP cyclohydrolase, partial [Bdellovibrionales bacterium]|nr:phosphoribosyl-AMP cyclohydrolase [Bdellovibrionales bacterium]
MEKLDFAKGNGLIPVVVQDVVTHQVLMLGYMNHEAVEKTVASNQVTFFSRSKQRIWTKGESSGNTLAVASIHVDCDFDTLLIRATPAGPVCHTGDATCFHDDRIEDSRFLG